MAKDVITRFRLETTQFDSKLRDTAKGLQNIAKQAEMGGKDFNNFSQKAIESARALGTVASGANNTKDKLKDLVGSYNDAAKAYNSLSEAAKQGEFGKAMAESLNQLQSRIKETKEELYSLGDAAKGKGGLFGEGGLTGMLQVAGGNLISSGIEKVIGGLKDAWTQSIELAKAGEGVRLAFERLNKPGLLDNLKEATHGTVSELELMKAAVKFDDFKLPVEQLGTLLAFAQKKAKDTGQSVDYMVDSIVTGLGRKSLMILDNLGLSAAQIKDRMKEGGDMTKAVAEIIKEQMAEAGEYVETAADRASQAAAKAADEMEAFGRQAAPIAEEWGQVWNALSIGAMGFANTLLGPVAESIRSIQNILSAGPDDDDYKEAVIEKAFNKLGKQSSSGSKKPTWGDVPAYTAPGGYVQVTDTNTGAVIGGQHFDNLNDANAIKKWRKSLHKTPKSGSTKNLPEYADFSKQVFKNSGEDLKASFDFVSPFEMFKGQSKFDPENILGSKDAWDDYKDTIAGTVGSIEESFDNLTQWTPNFDPLKDLTKIAKQNQMAMGLAAQSATNLGNALASMEDPAAKAAGTVISAIANIAMGFGLAVAQAGSLGPWAWLAYVAAGTAALATTISTVHSLTGYAQGGIVKGNSYSGDNMMFGGDGLYGLNAGEVVLTKAQQNNLAQTLEGNGLGNINVTGRLNGTDILLSADRAAQASGRGQLVTWK